MRTSKQAPGLAAALTNAPRGIAYSCYGYRPQSQFMAATGFNGQYIDLFSGHYQLGSYRTYNTGLMRFHSPDSASPFSRGGLNAYAYCSGDPINNLDPSGHGPISFIKSIVGKNKTIMQRREEALTSIKNNPALEPYRPIAENSVIDNELRTLSRTGKGLNIFTELMEKRQISTTNQGGLEYSSMDAFDIVSYQSLEIKIIENEKVLDSLLSAYHQPEKNKPSIPSTSLPPATINKLTRTQ